MATMRPMSPSRECVSALMSCRKASSISLLCCKNLSSALSKYCTSSEVLSLFLFPRSADDSPELLHDGVGELHPSGGGNTTLSSPSLMADNSKQDDSALTKYFCPVHFIHCSVILYTNEVTDANNPS